ncbi:hypothetical protein H5410_022162 [Solanum commersonii]|uniref:Uncharacterized protein n=1 Tax=Solanum commersonii TaxID=4109 RepID=A0A9J5ZDF2_SOLCO|nr:hypothetical protein H5410_022162 [Solanum commersonii]
MKKLGKVCLDDLLWYNLDIWCKRYFQDHRKCDIMDNNMAESFNENRVKMMKSIGDLRQFSNTWITDIYLLCL